MGTQILVPLGEHYHLRKRGKTMKRIHSTVLLLGESGTGKEVFSPRNRLSRQATGLEEVPCGL